MTKMRAHENRMGLAFTPGWFKFQGVIYAGFSTVFLLIGVLSEGTSIEILSTSLFVVTSTIAFLLPVSKLSSRRFSQRKANTATDNLGIATLCITLIIGLSLIAIMYVLAQVPILANNVEYARMTIVSEFSLVYRIGVRSLTFAGSMVVILLHTRRISGPLALLVLVILATVTYTLGFRSYIADLVACMLTTYFLLNIKAIARNLTRLVLRAGPIVIFLSCIAFYGVVKTTQLRHSAGSFWDAYAITYHRLFLLNYEVNIWRIYEYVQRTGYQYGLTYVSDFYAAISPYPSMQQEITSAFNNINSNLFVMTPTAYGEAYLNFGVYSCVLILPIVMIYRFITEIILAFGLKLMDELLFFAMLSNTVYFFPRYAATGGFSNSFIIGFGTITILAFAILAIRLVLFPRRNLRGL